MAGNANPLRVMQRATGTVGMVAMDADKWCGLSPTGIPAMRNLAPVLASILAPILAFRPDCVPAEADVRASGHHTAERPENVIPAVVAAPAGIVTTDRLPQIVGHLI